MILSFCSFVIALIVLHVHNLVNICAQVFIRMKTKSTTFICICLISHYLLSKFSLSSCTKCCKTRNFNLIIVRGLMELFGVGNLLVLHHSYLKGYINSWRVLWWKFHSENIHPIFFLCTSILSKSLPTYNIFHYFMYSQGGVQK